MADFQKRVVYVRAAENGRVLRIGISGGDGVTVSHTVSLYSYPAAASFAVGDLIDEREYENVCRSEQVYKAKKRALSILALSDNNEKTLKMKLVAKGIDRDIADDVCRQMVELGYVDEQRQLRRLIANDANNKFFGPRKIYSKLTAKGYSPSDIKSVMRELSDDGEIDFKRSAAELVEKSYPNGAEDEDKKRLLYKHGY